MNDSKISILIPYKPDAGRRDRNWAWLRQRYDLLLPRAQICMGLYNEEPFSRGAAINRAARQATGEFLFITDTDMVLDLQTLDQAFSMLEDHAWVIPFITRYALSEAASNALLAESPDIILADYGTGPCDIFTWEVGGACLLPRKCFEQAGGFDERFIGWGAEDNAFEAIIDTLCGKCARPADSKAWHLHHERSWDTTFGNANYQANRELFARYHEAYGNREAIEELIDERLQP